MFPLDTQLFLSHCEDGTSTYFRATCLIFFFFFELYSQNNLIFFSDSNTKKICHLWFVRVVCSQGFQLEYIFNCQDTGLHSPPSSPSFQDWPSPEGRWRFQLYALTNSTLSLTGGHLGIPCSIQGFQFTERKKQLKLRYYWEGGKDLQPPYNSDTSGFISQRADNFVCGLTLTSAFHLAAPCYRSSLYPIF